MGKSLVLFDVDGTLTPPRNPATDKVLHFLKDLRTKVSIGIVGGSDFDKIQEQLRMPILENFDYVFSENGLLAYKNGQKLAEQSIKEYLGEEKLKKLIAFVLHYIADLDIPIKRGTFIEFRKGMLNISPIGRNCSQSEREEFERFDLSTGVRREMVKILAKQFAEYKLKYSIGGQISFDVFPVGWDKTYCLRFVEDEFEDIHFFGDKTYEGGNDYEIFNDPRVKGHTVASPNETVEICNSLFSNTT